MAAFPAWAAKMSDRLLSTVDGGLWRHPICDVFVQQDIFKEARYWRRCGTLDPFSVPGGGQARRKSGRWPLRRCPAAANATNYHGLRDGFSCSDDRDFPSIQWQRLLCPHKHPRLPGWLPPPSSNGASQGLGPFGRPLPVTSLLWERLPRRGRPRAGSRQRLLQGLPLGMRGLRRRWPDAAADPVPRLPRAKRPSKEGWRPPLRGPPLA